MGLHTESELYWLTRFMPHETREWKRNKKEDIQVPINWCDKKPRGLGLSWIGRVGIRKAAGRKWPSQ